MGNVGETKIETLSQIVVISCKLIILTLVAVISSWALYALLLRFIPSPVCAIDAAINSSCLILSFEQFKSYYARICKPCRICCEKPCMDRLKRMEERELGNVEFTELKAKGTASAESERQYDSLDIVHDFSKTPNHQSVRPMGDFFPTSDDSASNINGRSGGQLLLMGGDIRHVSDGSGSMQMGGVMCKESIDHALSVEKVSKNRTITTRGVTETTRTSTAYESETRTKSTIHTDSGNSPVHVFT